MKRLALFALICLPLCSAAETHIGGDIREIEFTEAGNPYIVDQDLLVPSGKKVVIKEGCVFLFNAFTGLMVRGQLVVDGTREKPVVFTSIHDAEYNPESEQLPNAFDWNGVLISRESSGAHLSHFKCRYSVYGIKVQNPSIKIEDGLFYQNGQFHFTVNDKVQYVQDNIPYSYSAGGDATAKAEEEAESKTTSEPKRLKGSREKRIVRFVCLGVGVVGVGTGTVFGIRAKQHNDRLNQLTASYRDYPKDEFDKLWSETDTKKRDSIVATAILESLGVLGFAGFGLTFVF